MRRQVRCDTRSDAPNGRARRPSPATCDPSAQVPNCQGSYQETHECPRTGCTPRPAECEADWRVGVARPYAGSLPELRQTGGAPVTDGPLIVQSDKTLLLEVDHPDALACRMAIAPFAELERSPEHVHTYRLTPARPVERPGGRPRRRVGGRRAAAVLPVPGAARAAGRRGRHDGPVRAAAAGQRPGARPGAARPRTGPCWSRWPKSKKLAGMLGAQDRRRTRSRCTRPSAAGSSRRCSSSAGRPRTWPATSTARRTRSRCTRTAGSCAPTSSQAVEQFLGRRLGRGRAALRRRQDPGRRGGDGPGQRDHADPGDQHRRRPAVEAGAASPVPR